MMRKRTLPKKPVLGSVEWQRMVIREEAREEIKNRKKAGNEKARQPRAVG